MTQGPSAASGRPPRTPKSPAEKEAIRAKLRRAGLGCVLVGLLLSGLGLLDVLITEENSRFWMILAGIPLAAVGARMLQLSNSESKGSKRS